MRPKRAAKTPQRARDDTTSSLDAEDPQETGASGTGSSESREAADDDYDPARPRKRRRTSEPVLATCNMTASTNVEGTENDEDHEEKSDEGDGGNDDVEEEGKHDEEDENDDSASGGNDADEESVPGDPIEILFSISVFTSKEFQKSSKTRRAMAAGLLKLQNTLPQYRFLRTIIKKTEKLTHLPIPDDEIRIFFQIPRHVPSPIELDDDKTAYQHMMTSALKLGSPAVNIMVELETAVEPNSSSEKDQGKSKNKAPKTKVSNENDIHPANAAINLKIQLLRNKYTCNVPDGSDYCWVNADGKHAPLGRSHFRAWAAAWEQGVCDDKQPPNHYLFDSDTSNGRSSLLQQRVAAQSASRPTPTAPVINNHFTIPDALLNLLPRSAEQHAPLPAHGAANASNDMLLPPRTEVGPKLSITEFCDQYELNSAIVTKLASEGYKSTATFRFISLDDLKKMNFLSGEIAELREAVSRWAVIV